MSNTTTYTGSCFCGAVKLAVNGEPEAMGYCHCDSCRHWSAAPINAFTLWKPDAVRIIRGEKNIGSFNKTPQSQRKWCKTCGGHILTEHPDLGLTDISAAILPELHFTPGVHVNYQEKVLRIHDGLQKFRDLPDDIGGSGVSMSE